MIAIETSIRPATFWDVPRLVAMFQQFVETSQYAQYIGNDATCSASAIQRMVESDDAAIFVRETEHGVVGMLGVSVSVQPFSGERIAAEHFWWLDPKHRGYGGWLLKRAEKWAKAKGATRMMMMAPVDKPRVAETYARLGYAEVERIFQRDL